MIRYMNDKLEGVFFNGVVTQLRFYSGICLKSPKKTTKDRIAGVWDNIRNEDPQDIILKLYYYIVRLQILSNSLFANNHTT
jgi:hypothetical protein